MTDRHYTDDEVAAIFRVAAEGSASSAPPSGSAGGLTLRDLQGIAREVGIAPDAVAEAARSLDRPLARPASRTFLRFRRKLSSDPWLGPRREFDDF